MGLETATYIEDLVATNPVGATDFASQGDDHLRLLKAVLKAQFPNLGQAAVTYTAAQLNDTGRKSATQTVSAVWTFSAIPVFSAGINVSGGTVTLPSASVADAALSSNVALKNGTYAFSGTITFNNAPVLPAASIADASLSSNVPLKNAANTFTDQQTVSNAAGGVVVVTDTVATGRIAAAGSTAYVGSFSAHPFDFYSNSTQRGRIAAAGNWTINAPSSGAAFTATVLNNTNGHVITDGSSSLVAGIDSSNRAFAGAVGSSDYDLYAKNARVVRLSDGAQIGSPTGGDKGAGTLNTAGQIFVNEVNVRSLPAVTSTSTTLAKGQAHYITGNATLPALAAGEWVAIINNSGSPITISENSGDTTYWSTGAVSVATVTVPARGRILAEGVGSTTVYISGDVSGYS